MNQGTRLSPTERARLVAGVDPDALERLLEAAPPELRERLRRAFLTESGATGPYNITIQGSPKLEQLLGDVWEPLRDRLRADPSFWSKEGEMLRQYAPAWVVLVRELDIPDAVAAVVRRAAPEPEEIILLNRSLATGEVWAVAALALQEWRADSSHQGQEVQQQYVRMANVMSFRESDVAEHLRSHVQGLQERVNALRAGPYRDIPGIGQFPAEIYYPAGSLHPQYPVWHPLWRPS